MKYLVPKVRVLPLRLGSIARVSPAKLGRIIEDLYPLCRVVQLLGFRLVIIRPLRPKPEDAVRQWGRYGEWLRSLEEE